MDFNGFEWWRGEVVLAVHWYTWIAAIGLPGLVALVTKRFANSRVKDLTLVALTAFGAVLIESNGTFYVDTFVLSWLFLFVAGCGIHYRFLKKWGITGAQGILANLPWFKDKGIGAKYGDGDLPEEPGEGEAAKYPKLQDPLE